MRVPFKLKLATGQVRLAYIPKFMIQYRMREERDENTPNISQRAYVIAKSLSELMMALRFWRTEHTIHVMLQQISNLS